MAKTAKQYKQRFSELNKEKDQFRSLWQWVGKYVHQRKLDFSECHTPGEFLVSEVFASTAPKSARKMAQVLVGMLWQGGKSIRLKRPQSLKETAEIKAYFEKATENVQEDLDDDRNGLTQALAEDMYDQVTFGTAGVGCFSAAENSDTLLDFMAYGVDECAIDENAKGKIDTMYCLRRWTVKQVVEEYGIDNVSSATARAFNGGKVDDHCKVLWVIEPRKADERKGEGNLSYSIASCHMEWESEKILRKSGYEEMPVEWIRMYKQRGEKYGRSPTTDALADVFEENFLAEGGIVANEKALDPPLVINDDGVAGAGYIDSSAGGIIVVNTKGRQTSAQNPVYPLFEGSNINQNDKRREELKVSIKEHYNLDRLLDFSAEREMTLGEAQILENIRAQSMMEMFSNQIVRMKKLMERAISILFRAKRLGVFPSSPEAVIAQQLGLDILLIPEEVERLIKSGREFYQIEFLTPASRLLKAEQAKGTMQLWQFAGEVPELAQNLDPIATLEVLADAWGAPSKVMRSDKAMKAIQASAAQGAQDQNQLDQAQQMAEVAKTVSEASAQEQTTA